MDVARAVQLCCNHLSLATCSAARLWACKSVKTMEHLCHAATSAVKHLGKPGVLSVAHLRAVLLNSNYRWRL